MNIEIKNIYASVEGKNILNGVSMTLESGTLSVLMGPNGSGKSTLANVIMGNPEYKVESGEITIDGNSILEWEPHERARKGIFMSFQHPVEVPGLTVGRFLRRAYESIHKDVPSGFVAMLRKELDILNMNHNFINRYLNEGFSGGEKKRMEILQMSVLKPKFALLDEIDSGLDIDAIRIIAEGINRMRKNNSDFSVLVITHYKRIIECLENPSEIYVMSKGKIVEKGSSELLDKLEEKGYRWLSDESV